MIEYPQIDPVIFSVGPLAVRWYGMMYLLGFLAAFWLGRRRSMRPDSPLATEQVEDLIFFGALGAVLGGRVGYVFFYGFDRFLENPLWLFKIWEGGMSFHGGLLGVVLALTLFARRIGRPAGAVADFVAPLAPIGLGLGRLANFINGELWGRETEVPWAMVFPADSSGLARHPSQLYQAFLEGVVLLLIVLWFARRPRPYWSVGGVFLIVYGMARFFVEFYREPDAALALGWMTRGQLLSTPMIVAGIMLLLFAYRNGGSVSVGQAAESAPGVRAEGAARGKKDAARSSKRKSSAARKKHKSKRK